MISNREISRLFSLYAELLLLHETDERLAALLSGASYRIRNSSTPVMQLEKKEMSQLFRQEIIAIIRGLKKTNTIHQLDELIQLTPQGLFEMMRIKGLGGKKLSALWKVAEIDTIDSLLNACKKDLISKIPGFGAKSQANITAAIENYRSSREDFRFASVSDAATQLVNSLQIIFKSKLVSLTGAVRRNTNTVSSVEIIADVSQKKFIGARLQKLLVIQSSTADKTKAHTLDEIPVTIYHSSKDRFYYDLLRTTGNESHVAKVLAKLGRKRNYLSEEAIYKSAELRYVVPEMRENIAEWNFKAENDELVTDDDIKGVVHNHTTWSDGVDSLRAFVTACKNQGYEYTVISDHSKNAHYAGGLKEEKVLKQMQEIDQLNKELFPFRIFKSIECDIRVSGDLDYENTFLKKLDLVIISIHQLLKMDKEKATNRLIKAIENPFATILGHMTGRQLLIRPGYPVDFKKVIDACAANQVIIEINANPYRLDVDWTQIPYALKQGVMISVNPDAHSIRR